LINGQQIFAVAAFGGLLRNLKKMLRGDVTEAKCDFLGAGDPQPLPLFQDLHEMTGLDQRGMGTGIKACKASALNLNK